MALTAKKRRFVETYLREENPKKAAEAAGYGADYGRKLLGQEEVKKALAKAREQEDARRVAGPEEILALWTKIIRREDEVCDYEVVRTKTRREYLDDQGKKVVEDTEAQELVKIPPSLRDVMKAAQEVIDRWDKFMAPGDPEASGVVEIPAVLPVDGEDGEDEGDEGDEEDEGGGDGGEEAF